MKAIFLAKISVCLLSVMLQAQIESLPIFKAKADKDENYFEFQDDGTPTDVFPGDSWYDGGVHVTKFNTSSFLKPNKEITYGAQNAHDFNIVTAWVEGDSGHGIGAYLEYEFDTGKMTYIGGDHNYAIYDIYIANGYKKSKRLWESNSRVKKFKMYVNGEPFGILELLDAFEFQTISIPKIPLPPKGLLTLRFEIMEVYPGTKYKDTAITELLFSGSGIY